jgi:hypothetical protein
VADLGRARGNGRSRLVWLLVAALVAVVVAAAVILVGQPFDRALPAVARQSAPVSRTASISLADKTIALRPHVHPVLPAHADRYASPDSETVRITPSGPLARQAVVKLPLSRPPGPGQVVVVLTSESPTGPWRYLPGTVIDGGRYVQATVRHLSFFSTLLIDVQAVIDDLKGAFSAFTDNAYSNASQPSCADNSVATQGGYSVLVSNKGNTVLGCFGLENGQRVLKVVDNRRYPLLVAHGLPVVGGSSSGDVFQKASSLLNLGDVLIYPQEEVDFGATLQPGQSGAVAGDYAPVANYVYAVSTGVEAWETIVTRGGTADNPSRVMDAVDQAMTIDSCRAAATSGDIQAVQGDCLSPDAIGQMFGKFWGVVAGLVQEVSSFYGWVHSVLNAFVDSIDGRATFDVKVVRAAGAPTSTLSSYLGYWGAHDAQLCLGSVLPIGGPGSKVTTTPPCDGSTGWGWISFWACGAQTSNGTEVCLQYYAVRFAENPNGSVTGTIAGNPIFIDEYGNVVNPVKNVFQAFKEGETFTLAHAGTGLLGMTYQGRSSGYFCNYHIVSAANRPKCGA